MKTYTREEFKKVCFEVMDQLRNEMEDKGISTSTVLAVSIAIMPYIGDLAEALFTEEVDTISIDKEN